MTNPVFNHNGFRFYDDDGAHTVLQDENVDHSIVADVNFTLRMEAEVTNAKAVSNKVFTLFAEKNATGGFNAVTGVSTNGIQIELSANFADGDADNNDRLTSSALTFVNGALQEATPFSGPVGGYDYVGTDHWEVEVCLAIDNANSVNGDTYDVRLHDAAGVALDSYTRVPRATDSTSATFVPQQITSSYFLTH